MKLKIKNRYLKIISAFIGLCLLAAGCGGSATPSAQHIVLNFWDPFESSQNFQPIFNAYEQLHPNVQIIYTKKNIDTYPTDLLNALASGSGPDIFSINNNWLPQYLDKVTPQPTSTVYSFKAYKETFVNVAVNDFTLNQQIYGIPLYVDSLGLFYNKSILGTAGISQPPQTWLDLESDVRKIVTSFPNDPNNVGYFNPSGVAMGTNVNVNRGVDILYLLMLQSGAIPYSPDGTQPMFAQTVTRNGNTNNPGLDALNFYTSFANPNNANYNWNSQSDYSIDAFVNGKAAFLFSYPFTIATIREENPNLDFDVAPVPQPSLSQPAINFADYWGEVVNKQSKYSSAAWDFLNFMTSKTSLTSYYKLDKQPSSRNDIIAEQEQDPDIGIFANANLTAESFYKPDQVQMDDIFGQMIDNVILNGMSTQDALTQAEQQAATLTQGSQ
jgi:multiple sugar transport system substrate-binding protein